MIYVHLHRGRELKYFIFTHFCSMLVEQVIGLRKVRTENLKFRTV